MINYVIMWKDENEIRGIQQYDDNQYTLEMIEEKIKEWTGDTKPELIKDKKIIDILEFIFKRYDYNTGNNKDLKERCEELEDSLDDIQRILDRF